MGTPHVHAPPAVVVEWRRRVLERKGFPHALAAAVASDTRYELHALVGLTARGCPPQLAVRILAPLTEEHTPSEETT